MGYVITYARYTVLWCNELQTEIDLSKIEAEYILLVQAMRKVIAYMWLMKKVYLIFDIYLPNPEAFCKLFEDNQSFISVVESNKFLPKTKISLLIIIASETSS